MGDLDSCPGITRAEAEGAVIDNTAIKIIYKIGDSTFAEKLSKNSGKIPLFVERTNKTLDDKKFVGGGWSETHTQLIDADVLTHLPMSTDSENQVSAGVLFGVGEAKIFHIDHIKVNGDQPVPEAAPEHLDLSKIDEDCISICVESQI